jgi:hypothetical protein
MAPSYRILAIGVNHARGQSSLTCAENDANDIVTALTSGIGPPGARATPLVGSSATRANVLAQLKALADERPQRLVFFFSGHGSTSGICLADKLLCYHCIANGLRDVRAQSTIIILDTCHAGAFARHERREDVGDPRMAGIEDDLAWARVLSAAAGHRVLLATSETALAHEFREVGNSRFTAALLDAFTNAAPDLWQDGIGFISDAAAFTSATRYMKGTGQVPKRLGRLGDFPMVRSELAQQVGAAEIRSLMLTDSYAATAACELKGRRHLPTTVRFCLRHADGTLISAKSMRVFAEADRQDTTYRVTFDADVLTRDARARTLLSARSAVPVTWTFEVEDGLRRVLGARGITQHYAVPTYG